MSQRKRQSHLTAPLKKAMPGKARAAASKPVIWCFDSAGEDAAGAAGAAATANFLPFERSISAQLEEAYATDPNGVCVIRVGGDGYRVNFDL